QGVAVRVAQRVLALAAAITRGRHKARGEQGHQVRGGGRVMLVYATIADLTGRLDPIPANAAALIRTASAQVRDITSNDLYDITPAGLPTDPDLRDVLREATCVQVLSWVAAGIDPSAAPLRPEIASQSADGGSVSYQLPDPDRIQRAGERLCHEAVLVLRNAGMATGRPLIC
ncbi:hypothetical protein, partial [Nocardia sp. JCM 34519]